MNYYDNISFNDFLNSTQQELSIENHKRQQIELENKRKQEQLAKEALERQRILEERALLSYEGFNPDLSLKSMEDIETNEDENNKRKESHNNENNPHRIEAKNVEKKKSIIEKAKEIPGKAKHITQRFRIWSRKAANSHFYRKYLDRLQSGLWEKTASSAPVYENRMKGDPVKILKNEAQVYIQEITKKINELYHVVLNMSKKLERTITAEECINVIKEYCAEYASEKDSHGSKIEQDKLSWEQKLLNATKFKIAKIIMRNGEHKVYGYTMRSIVQKGYPKPNYLIVSLFVANPEEKPERQVVSDIFEGPDSFEILADADKKDIFSISGMTEAVLSKTVSNNVINDIKLNRENALKAFSHAKDNPNKKDEAKVIDSIWDGIRLSCKELLSRKNYIIDCINIYFDMIIRIDKLAKASLNSMLEVENSKLDNKYKRQAGFQRKIDNNNYDEDGNLVSTKTDRKIEHTIANRNNTIGDRLHAKSDPQYDDLRKTAKELNKSFK